MDFHTRTLLQSLLILLTFLLVTLGDININDPDGEEYTLPEGRTVITLKCTSDGVDIVWYKDEQLLSQGGRVTIVTIVQGSVGFSTLRIDGARGDDAGMYACRNPNNAEDQDVVRVTVPSANRELKPVQIIGLPDKQLDVLEGNTFSVQCTADLATQVMWVHKGVRIGDGVEDVAISLTRNSSAMTQTSTLRKDNAVTSDAGRYVCKDRSDNTNKDSVTVHVKPKPKLSVNITLPKTEETTITVGKSLNLKCEADANRLLTWSKNGVLIQGEQSSDFIITNVANQGGKTISLLSKDEVTMDDAGIYDCTNKMMSEDKDTVSVIVKDMSDVRTETTNVPLRVGEPLNLQCSLRSAAEATVTWLKDGQQVATGDAYMVEGNELQIKHSKKSDAGIYECHFQNPDSSEVIGVLKHNVTTRMCQVLSAPSNGGFVKCPSHPVYGQKCSFKCDEGFTLRGSASRSCNLNDDGETFWSGKEAMCEADNEINTITPKSTEIPVTTSKFILRAGTKKKLNCKWDSPGEYTAIWEKDGMPITENSETYTLGDDFLTVEVTGIQNKGVYKCALVGDADGQTVGIKLFNATAKRCPVLKTPVEGELEDCPEKPIYGSVCSFKCHEGYTLVGDNQRVCEEKPNGRKYYWTGKRPQCQKDSVKEEPTEGVVSESKEEKRHDSDGGNVAESKSGTSGAPRDHAHFLVPAVLTVTTIGLFKARFF